MKKIQCNNKLIIMAYKNSATTKTLLKELQDIKEALGKKKE